MGTPLQSAMTRRQLFEAKSPLWASNLDINRMYQVLTTVQNARENGVDKELMEYFDDLCNTERFFMALNISLSRIILKTPFYCFYIYLLRNFLLYHKLNYIILYFKMQYCILYIIYDILII